MKEERVRGERLRGRVRERAARGPPFRRGGERRLALGLKRSSSGRTASTNAARRRRSFRASLERSSSRRRAPSAKRHIPFSPGLWRSTSAASHLGASERMSRDSFGYLIAKPTGVSEAQIRPFAYTAAPLKKCLHSRRTSPIRPEVARLTMWLKFLTNPFAILLRHMKASGL
jgi:hypothetical protein